jgi:hypothetical protein
LRVTVGKLANDVDGGGDNGRLGVVEASPDAIERDDKRRASSLKLIREATAEELTAALTGFDRVERDLSTAEAPCNRSIDLPFVLAPRVARVATPNAPGAAPASANKSMVREPTVVSIRRLMARARAHAKRRRG